MATWPDCDLIGCWLNSYGFEFNVLKAEWESDYWLYSKSGDYYLPRCVFD